MANYTLIGTASIVQVLTPKVSQEMEAVTIQTHPTGIFATTLVAKEDFDAGTAAPLLADFAGAIETVMAQGKAVSASGSSGLDASRLQAYVVTFEVGYNPPGAPKGSITADVDVPVGLLTTLNTIAGVSPLGEAEAMIDRVYSNLVSLSGGAPAAATAGKPVAPASSGDLTGG